MLHRENQKTIAVVATSVFVVVCLLPVYQQQVRAPQGVPNSQDIYFIGAGYSYCSSNCAYNAHYWLWNLYYDYIYNRYGNLDHVQGDRYWWYAYTGYPGQPGVQYYFYGDITFTVCSSHPRDPPWYGTVPFCGSA